MISMCTVLIDALDPFLEILLEWLPERSKLISEVCFCKVDADESYYEEWTVNNIKFKKFGYKFPPIPRPQYVFSPCHQHALGLHECVDRTTQPYIYMCDPDVFFYTAVDEFYFNLMEKYELDIIGASHHSATEIAQRYFPWHGSYLVRKDKMPDSEFLKGKIDFEGKYFLGDPIPETVDAFPNPKGTFDTGAYLWYWAHLNDWKWLAFQTLDVYNYTSVYHRGNVKIKEKIEKRKLLYHAVSGSIKPGETIEPFKKAYEESKEDMDEDDD